ncbi:HesB/YadR/YfhF family protein [Bacillus pinisoli]|uniref:HesB/YadR/YfhF family protein n=1 Tax=Bacillus pinisoli TaxID=2901866 RepID=UPI001FF33B99|nr:HesB/YadR/YfhF family protein [Bacillus pinisoli]
MKLTIDEKAASWYIDELHLKQGDYLRFYVRYGGHGTVLAGFSLGVSKDAPEEIGNSVTIKGIHFFIEERDLWYFDGHNLHIQFNENYLEPEFMYKKP